MSDSFLTLVDLGIRSLLYSKFKDDMEFTNIDKDTTIAPVETAPRVIAERRGKTDLEFMNIWRSGITMPWGRHNTTAARRGLYTQFASAASGEDENHKINLVKAMPVQLEYDVWFWSKDSNKLNNVTETYLFWQHRNPNLELNYNDELPLEIDLHFSDIVDESRVSDKYEKGLIFLKRFSITADAWVFEDADIRTVHRIVVTGYSEETEENVKLFEETYEITED